MLIFLWRAWRNKSDCVGRNDCHGSNKNDTLLLWNKQGWVSWEQFRHSESEARLQRNQKSSTRRIVLYVVPERDVTLHASVIDQKPEKLFWSWNNTLFVSGQDPTPNFHNLPLPRNLKFWQFRSIPKQLILTRCFLYLSPWAFTFTLSGSGMTERGTRS